MAHRTLPAAIALLLWAVLAQAAEPTTCLWRVEGPGGTLWLLGSIHLLAPEASELPPAMERAVAGARRMVFEVDFDSAGDAGTAILRRASLPGEQRLSDLLDPRSAERLGEALLAVGLQPADLEGFKPWYVAITLAGMELRQAGYEPGLGIDLRLWNRARAAGIPTAGLETVAQQIAFLDGLGLPEQVELLRQTLDEMDRLVPQVEEITRLWRTGRAGELAELLGSTFAETPGLYRRLVVERNRAWLPEIERLARTEHHTVVVVGVLHLVGDEGLVALLRRDGFTVTQE